MSEPELHRPPPIPLDQYAGKWIVWDRTKTRILTSTRTLEVAAGEVDPVYDKVPKGQRWPGAISVASKKQGAKP